METSRAVRLRQPKKPFTPSRNTVTQSKTNYNINPDKALQQKLEAVSREDVSVELKHGNLVIIFSAAVFEAFRSVLRIIMNSNPFPDTKWIPGLRRSRNGMNTAEETVSVVRANNQLYRINLYLTTSTVNVNGKQLQIFIDDHLPLIITMMNNSGNFDVMNRCLKEQLSKILNNKRLKKLKQLPTATIFVHDLSSVSESTSSTSNGSLRTAASQLAIMPKINTGEQMNCLVCDMYCKKNRQYYVITVTLGRIINVKVLVNKKLNK